MKVRLITCLMCLATAGYARAQQAGYDAITAYGTESIQGFTVLINRHVAAQKEDAAEARKELERQLKEISRVVLTGPLAALRKVRIWVEWNRKENGGAEFHPSVKWLQDNGYNPEKAGGIEISNTRNFVKWSAQTLSGSFSGSHNSPVGSAMNRNWFPLPSGRTSPRTR